MSLSPIMQAQQSYQRPRTASSVRSCSHVSSLLATGRPVGSLCYALSVPALGRAMGYRPAPFDVEEQEQAGAWFRMSYRALHGGQLQGYSSGLHC